MIEYLFTTTSTIPYNVPISPALTFAQQQQFWANLSNGVNVGNATGGGVRNTGATSPSAILEWSINNLSMAGTSAVDYWGHALRDANGTLQTASIIATNFNTLTVGSTCATVQSQLLVNDALVTYMTATGLTSGVIVMAWGGPVSLQAYTVATLPTSPTAGMEARVTDGTSGLSLGATVTGGHSTNYKVWYNGTNWTITGV